MTESTNDFLDDTELGLAVESLVDTVYTDLHTRLLALADSWHVSDARMAEALGRVATPEQHWSREVTVERGVSQPRYLVIWQIDDTDESPDPRSAAQAVWDACFVPGHSPQPGDTDACVFTVLDRVTGIRHQIDLSDDEAD